MSKDNRAKQLPITGDPKQLDEFASKWVEIENFVHPTKFKALHNGALKIVLINLKFFAAYLAGNAVDLATGAIDLSKIRECPTNEDFHKAVAPSTNSSAALHFLCFRGLQSKPHRFVHPYICAQFPLACLAFVGWTLSGSTGQSAIYGHLLRQQQQQQALGPCGQSATPPGGAGMRAGAGAAPAVAGSAQAAAAAAAAGFAADAGAAPGAVHTPDLVPPLPGSFMSTPGSPRGALEY